MNTVISLNAFCEREHVVRMFDRFANRYGTIWTNRLGNMSSWDDCIDEWYSELKEFDYKTLVNAAKSAFIVYAKYPPTFGQFHELCRNFSGFPKVEDVIKSMISRDFAHPITKMIYDKVGSWTLINGKENDINDKAKIAYNQCLADFQSDPQLYWNKLTVFNSQPKLKVLPEKIPSHQERMTFNERMAECLKRAEESKRLLGDHKHPEFANKETDKEVWATYKKYLLDLPEELVITLPITQAYDRNRFLAAIDTVRFLKEVGYDPNLPGRDKNASKGIYGPQKIFKNWVMD